MRRGIFPAACVVLFTACSNGSPASPIASLGKTAYTASAAPSATTTLTPSITPTPTVTPTPTITFTPTPPPDLEFTEMSILPDTYDEVRQDYLIMGRMRNNTNTIMQFRGKFVAFRFNFEIWDWDKYNKESGPNYHHAKFHYDIAATNEGFIGRDLRNINCILFPGEEGIIYFDINYTSFYKKAEKEGISEYVDFYDGPVGLWYTYESFYETDPTIPRAYRIEAQNVQFIKLTTVMSFSFDVDLTQKHIFHYAGYTHSAWVIVYDKDQKIINILYSDISRFPRYDGEHAVHIEGDTMNVTHGGYATHFSPATKMTPEMIERADRIEVMTEIEEPQVCSSDYG
jgi:hypothetical protein